MEAFLAPLHDFEPETGWEADLAVFAEVGIFAPAFERLGRSIISNEL